MMETVFSVESAPMLKNENPRPKSEKAPQIYRTVTVKQELISGQEPQFGLDTKTDLLTDRQSRCDSDLTLT
jgi:hypothetical protein